MGAAVAKRFVIVVGPHETRTGATSFLSKYAANDGTGSPSFDGWSWPIIEHQDIFTSPKHVFDLIVKERDNAEIMSIIIDGIRTAWNEAKNGVFIGSLDFDKVGLNPYSRYNAVESLVRVIDEVGISAEDVTVIVTYRTPRISQWGLVWKNHFDALSYEDFICSGIQVAKRWEWLDTSMNPFKLAKAYHDQEWNVGIVDQDSILKAGKDVAHTIACLAMGNQNCEDGWVVGIEREIPQILTADEIDLSLDDRNDLEKLFLFRDCYYMSQLNHSPRFGVFAEDSGLDLIHEACKPSKEMSYAPLADTDFVLKAIQSQKFCVTDEIDVPTLLDTISAMTIDEWEDKSVSFGSVSKDEGGNYESEITEVGDEGPGSVSFDDEVDDEEFDDTVVDDNADDEASDIADEIDGDESFNDLVDDKADEPDEQESENDPIDDEANDEQSDNDLSNDNPDDKVSSENPIADDVDNIDGTDDLQPDGDSEGEEADDGQSEVADNTEANGVGNDESFTSEQYDDDFTYSIDDKKLIVFVGPHETDASDVTKFFANYAAANDDYEPLESFNGWGWPLIEDELIEKPAHRVFDYLVTDPGREDIQNVVIEGILDTLENATQGVIIGSLNFDSVGANPYSDYDPVGALYRLEDELGLSREDMTIAVTYRSPRIDHWSAIWYNHFVADDYEDFICSDDEQADKRWEWLDVVMNPFKIAKIYHDQGWNVAVIDQESAINVGSDTSHIIACYLMDGVNCTNGFVDGLEDIVSGYKDNAPMDSMTEEDRRELEQLFQERDCHYKYELKDEPGFVILNQRSAWSTCSEQHRSYYQQFTDTDFMLYVLKSQQRCLEKNLDVTHMLEKKLVHDEDKKMVIFAGPHETAGASVTRFFALHASEKVNTDDLTSLMGWSWPTVDSQILGDTAPHHIFDLLLSNAGNRPVQNLLMEGIRDSWNDSENGVIIGSLDFDRVGKNPYTKYDALGALNRVVETVGIAENDITIVLNYRSKRMDHLSAVWWNHFDAGSFQNFTCSDDEADKRWEWIDTVMNPLKLASAYIEEGWKVLVIEQEGTTLEGKDISHSIACNLMKGVDCVDGWITGLRTYTTSIPSSYEIDGLDEIQRIALEKLFRMRDCYYMDELESNEKFLTVNRNDMWKSCSSKDVKKYEKVANTDFLLGVMRSLQGCGEDSEPESTRFASQLRRSVRVRRQSTLIIAIVFITFIVTILIALKVKQTHAKRKKLRKAIVAPPEGVFRDIPANLDGGQSPYRDEVEVDENLVEYSIDGDNEIREDETMNIGHEEELGSDEELDVDTFSSRSCIIS